MDTVYIQYRKHDGTTHHRIEAERLGADEHGVWLYGRPGARAWVLGSRLTHERTGFIALVPHDAWWLAFWNSDRDQEFAIYVDVATPAEWTGNEVRLVDLDLDVVRRWDGSCAVLDEDEFDEHRALLGYPNEIVAAARQAAAWLHRAVSDRSTPFTDSPPYPRTASVPRSWPPSPPAAERVDGTRGPA